MITFLLFALALIPNVRAEDCEKDCIETNQWHLGLAIGIGVKTNPLQDGDNIPLVLLPDIAWYGENAYFDNGELGYQWQLQNQDSVSTFVSFNRERAFFSFWHISNILNPVEGNSFLVGEGPAISAAPEQREVSLDDISSRKWSLDGGLRWQHQLAIGTVSASIKTDVSGVHNGQQLDFTYRFNWQHNQWRFGLSPGISWKSQKLLDYYYGIGPEDNVGLEYLYQAEAGWQPQLEFNTIYPIAENWQLLLKLGYQWLNKGMYQSPLVKDKKVQSFFLGVTHQF